MDAYRERAAAVVERSLRAYDQMRAWEMIAELARQQPRGWDSGMAPVSELRIWHADNTMTVTCDELDAARLNVHEVAAVQLATYDVKGAEKIRSTHHAWFDSAQSKLVGLIVEKTAGFWWDAKKELVEKACHPSRLAWIMPHDDPIHF